MSIPQSMALERLEFKLRLGRMLQSVAGFFFVCLFFLFLDGLTMQLRMASLLLWSSYFGVLR